MIIIFILFFLHSTELQTKKEFEKSLTDGLIQHDWTIELGKQSITLVADKGHYDTHTVRYNNDSCGLTKNIYGYFLASSSIPHTL